MDFIKKNIKIITAFVVGFALASGVVGATVYQYQASDIKYGNTTVGAAVGDLYGAVNAQDGGSYGLKVDQLVYSDTSNNKKTYTCPSGKTCLVYVYSNNDSYNYVDIGSNRYYIADYNYGTGSNYGYAYKQNFVSTFLMPGGTTLNARNGNSANYFYGHVMVYTLK